jgi:alpha-tubulin suppressor-like RCC1 family protein
LYTWGFGGQGRLGHSSDQEQMLPKRVEFFQGKKIVTFTTGIDFSLVVVEKE